MCFQSKKNQKICMKMLLPRLQGLGRMLYLHRKPQLIATMIQLKGIQSQKNEKMNDIQSKVKVKLPSRPEQAHYLLSMSNQSMHFRRYSAQIKMKFHLICLIKLQRAVISSNDKLKSLCKMKVLRSSLKINLNFSLSKSQIHTSHISIMAKKGLNHLFQIKRRPLSLIRSKLCTKLTLTFSLV